MSKPNGRDCPRQKAGTHAEIADGVNTVVRPQGQRYVLNETALALWQLCDGKTTLEEMVSAICLLFGAAQPVITADVQRILDEFEVLHLIEWVGQPDPLSSRQTAATIRERQ